MESSARAFIGELDVEDNAFECTVDRLIYRAEGVTFEFSCFDTEGGAHRATGRASLDSLGRYRTDEFRVRYTSDRTDTAAGFQIVSLVVIDDLLSLKAVWTQAGDTFDVEGELSPFVKFAESGALR